MRQKRASSTSRWIDRSLIEDLKALKGQSGLAFQLYLSRIAEHRRTSGLGLVAPFISILVHVALLGSVMSLVFHEPLETFIPFFSISLCIWQCVSSAISESAGANEKTARYLSFPYISGYIIHFINMIELATNLLLKTLAAIAIIAFVNYSLLLKASYIGFCVGLLLVAIVSFTWALPIAYIFDRFRMLRGFLPQIIFAVYLLTPILWNPARLGGHRWVVDFNPVFHVIEVARSPIIYGVWPLTSIAVVLGLGLCGMLLSFLLYSGNRNLIVYRWIA